eukprot:s679_g22.t1
MGRTRPRRGLNAKARRKYSCLQFVQEKLSMGLFRDFGTSQDSKGAEAHVAEQVHKYAYNAERRYRRGLKWIEMDKKDDRKLQLEQATLRMRLAKAMSLAHMRFGENPEPASDAEKAALKEARELLAEVLTVSEALNNDSVKYECMKMNLQVCIQDEDVSEARKVLSRLQEEKPDDEDLKSDNARMGTEVLSEGLVPVIARIRNRNRNAMAEIRKVLTGQSMCTTDGGASFLDGFQSSGDEASTLSPQLGPQAAYVQHSSQTSPQGGYSDTKSKNKMHIARQHEDTEFKHPETATACGISLPPGLASSDDEQPLCFSEAFPYPGVPQTLRNTTIFGSIGSELHGTGECKPCAWFWHNKGCSKGSECTFCHNCPPGELKARRKLKVMRLRQQEYEESAQERLQQMSQDTFLPGALGAVGEMPWTNTPDMQAATAKLEADLQAMDGSPVKVSYTESWPSVGSQQHGTGECRPCAWFWKKGCLNGRECLHCHLCPEGELRRKKKDAGKFRSAPKDVRNITDALTRQQCIIEQQQQRLVDLQLQLRFQQQLMVATASITSSLVMEA